MERETIVPKGVKNSLWNFKKASFDKTFPNPLLGMPIPLDSKAAQRISSAMSAFSPGVSYYPYML